MFARNIEKTLPDHKPKKNTWRFLFQKPGAGMKLLVCIKCLHEKHVWTYFFYYYSFNPKI